MDNQKLKKTILIVEDDPSLLKILTDKFGREGFEVIVAENGLDGFNMALTKHPDLILLDIILPIMDGTTMMSKLREENEWGKTVPIILLTNLSADNDERTREVAKNEPAYYLVKSNWSLEDIVGKVKERLGM